MPGGGARGTLVGLDAAGDVDLDIGAADPVDHAVDERVVFGLAGMDLAQHGAGDVPRPGEGGPEEPSVSEELLVVAGQAGDRPAVEQEVAAFTAGHDGADDQVAARARSFSYSSVPSMPSASSSSPSSSKRACWASTKRRSSSSMKPCSHTPSGDTSPTLSAEGFDPPGPDPLLLEAPLFSSLAMKQIVAPAARGELLVTRAQGLGLPTDEHVQHRHRLGAGEAKKASRANHRNSGNRRSE